MFGAIAKTDFYGPSTEYRLISVHDTEAEAKAAAEAISEAAYDPQARAYRLGHNQSSPTRGIVQELYEVDCNDWQSFPIVLLDGLEALGRDEELAVDKEALVSAMENLGWIALADDDGAYVAETQG